MRFMRSKAITLCVINVGDVRALLLAILTTLVKSKEGGSHACVEFKIGILLKLVDKNATEKYSNIFPYGNIITYFIKNGLGRIE